MNTRTIISGAFLAIILMIPMIALADGTGPGFKNPLQGSSGADVTVQSLLTRVITFLLGLVGLLAMLAIVWGGIKYIISLGNDKGVQDAKSILKWAIVGLLVAGFSYAIVKMVTGELLGIS